MLKNIQSTVDLVNDKTEDKKDKQAVTQPNDFSNSFEKLDSLPDALSSNDAKSQGEDKEIGDFISQKVGTSFSAQKQ